AGKIGESLLSGLLSSGWRTPDEIVVTGRRPERVEELVGRYGVRGTTSNAEAVQGAEIVVVAIKPQDFDVLLGEIGPVMSEGQTGETSTQLVVQSMLGTAKLLRDEKMHPVELREMVTSPGGTTIRAIRELEQAGVRAAFLNAIQAAMERSKELAAGEL